MPDPRPTTLSPLKHRLFLMIWIAGLIGHFGNAVQGVGAAWLLTELGEPADVVALVQTAASLPIMLLSLPAGAIADMHDRRRMMLAAQGAALAVSSLLLMMALGGAATAWAVLALTMGLACCVAFYNPAVQTSLGALVPRHELAGAVSLNILGFNVARSLGPALGGWIVAAAGATAAFAVTGASFVLVLAMLLTWRPAVPVPGERVAVGRAIVAGARAVAASRELRTIMVRIACFTLAGSAAWALMPLVSRDLLKGGSVEFGLLLGALGTGAMLGAASATWFRHRYSSEAITQVAGLVYGGGCVAASFAPGLWPTLALLVLAGAGWVQALSGFSVASQLWAPRGLVGRVTAIAGSVTFGGLAIGSWGWGHAAADWGTGNALLWSGAAMLALPLLGLALPMPRHEAAG